MKILTLTVNLFLRSARGNRIVGIEKVIDGGLAGRSPSLPLQREVFMNWFKRRSEDRSTATPESEKMLLGYDGLYVSHLVLENEGTVPAHEYLKFTRDRRVFSIEIAFEPGRIDTTITQFHTIPSHMFSSGKYKIEDSTIKFATTSGNVVVEYTGALAGDRISLHSHSRFNSYESDQIFWYVIPLQANLPSHSIHPVDTASAVQIDSRVMDQESRLKEQAWQCSKNNDPVGAIRNFDSALEINPLDPQAFYGRGAVYCKTRNYTAAISDLNRAIYLVPDYPAAITERGLAFVETKHFEWAFADYDLAIRIDPTYAIAHVNKGSAYALQKDWSGAIACLSKGIRLSPEGSEEAYLNRAASYEALEDFANAAADLETYLRIFPQGVYSEHARKHLGLIEQKRDR